jgi:hypothetical protein
MLDLKKKHTAWGEGMQIISFSFFPSRQLQPEDWENLIGLGHGNTILIGSSLIEAEQFISLKSF